MLFNSGTPSLVSYTKTLLSDPTTAPREMFPEADVKLFINDAYTDLREMARQVGDNSALKISYEDAVEDQVDYTLPLDWVRLRSVHIDTEGNDLSKLPDNTKSRRLIPHDYVTVYDAWQLDKLTTNSMTYVGLLDRSFGIIGPPTADSVGTNSIRLMYEASTTELSADADEPTIARPHHYLICYMAASRALATKDQTMNQVNTATMIQKLKSFENQAAEELWDPDGAASIAGLDDQPDDNDAVGFYQ